MLEIIKSRCGIVEAITGYDDEIKGYIADALEDMRNSGVPPDIATEETTDQRVITAVALYVKAYLGSDRSDTDQYIRLYREKVFRLTLEEDSDVE